MMEEIWNDLLTDDDRFIIEHNSCRSRKTQLGDHPLLIIIDCQPNYVGEDKPIIEQLDRWPSGGGEKSWQSIRRIISLRDAAREAGVPVFYTKNVQKQTLLFDSFSAKTNRDQTKYLDGNPASDLIPELAPLPGELVLPKAYPSAFYGTPLLRYMTRMRIDTLIITGNSTSGCCRQTATDAYAMGYQVGFVQDCITDRTGPSHKIGMLDMWMKYGIVTTSSEVREYLLKIKKQEGVL